MENVIQTSFLDSLNTDTSVDILKPKRKKRRQLEINVDSALIELNLLLLPLAPVGRERQDVGSILVKWTDSQGANRGIKVSMTDGYGMLTRFDINVLTALQKLYSEQNKIIPYDFENNKYIMPIEINYTIKDIAKALRYQSCGGNLTKKIQHSIRKLANCTITSLFEGGIYDVESKSYIKGVGEKGFHIIEEYDMYKYSQVGEDEKRLKTKDIREYNKVVINKFFYNSMSSGYCKIVPFDQLLELKHDVSQRLFSLLEGWYCDKKPFVYFNYETLYARIPLNPVSDDEEPMPIKERNRAIKKSCEELVKTGYLQGFYTVPRKGVYFIFDGELKDADPDKLRDTYYGLHKYGDLKDVMNALMQHGIDGNDIDLYVKEDNIEYYKALLRYFDMMVRYDNIRNDNPVGYLLGGLKDKYNISEKYYNTI